MLFKVGYWIVVCLFIYITVIRPLSRRETSEKCRYTRTVCIPEYIKIEEFMSVMDFLIKGDAGALEGYIKYLESLQQLRKENGCSSRSYISIKRIRLGADPKGVSCNMD